MDADDAAQEPLLPPSAPASQAGEELRIEYHAAELVEARGGWGEARRLLALAAPLSAGQVLSYLGYIMVVAQIGRLGPLPLAAVSLGSTFFNVTGLSL
jgi:hypothetical protein